MLGGMKGSSGRHVGDFDWERLTCVHGSAREVPLCFEQLLDADDDVSMDALETLSELLFHQNDVSEATAAFVLASEDELRSPVGERRCEAFFDLFAGFAHAARSFDLGGASEREAALAAVLRNEPTAGAHGSMNTLAAARAQWAALERAVSWTEPYLTLREESAEWACRFLAAMGSAAAAMHDRTKEAFELGRREGWGDEARGLVTAAVGATGDERIVGFLRACLSDEAMEVSGAAATELLARLGGSCADEAVITALANIEDDVPDYFALESFDEIFDLLGDRADVLRARMREIEDAP